MMAKDTFLNIKYASHSEFKINQFMLLSDSYFHVLKN